MLATSGSRLIAKIPADVAIPAAPWMIDSAPNAWPLAFRIVTACWARVWLPPLMNGGPGAFSSMMTGIRSSGLAVISANSAGEIFGWPADCAVTGFAASGSVSRAIAGTRLMSLAMRLTDFVTYPFGMPEFTLPDG